MTTDNGQVKRQNSLTLVTLDHFKLKTYIRNNNMWYFAWILGVLLACAFGIINVMWMEAEEMLGNEKD